ncbi:MAG: hypothetical protein KDH17_00995 [Rhodocyclaceae bacterium]|nr:hypothetical protein [Rhodocyclaceae bacterium]
MKTSATILASALLSLAASTAQAQFQRNVYVNGQHLNAAQLAVLQQMHCAWIPDGAYWINTRSGAWGYAGNGRVQGYVGDPCRRGGGGRRKSLSERGLLYTPGDLNFR